MTNIHGNHTNSIILLIIILFPFALGNCSKKSHSKRTYSATNAKAGDASQTGKLQPSSLNEVTAQEESGQGGSEPSNLQNQMENTPPPEAAVTVETATVSNESVDILETADASRPPHQILDADALAAVYGRVFTEAPKFSALDRRILGTIDYFENPHSAKLTSVSNSYLKIIRGYAATECRNLARSDMAALTSQGQTPALDASTPLANPGWKLVPRLGPPSAAEVSGVMSRFFGYEPAEGDHRGADQFADLINENLKASNNLPQDIEETYTLLCIVAATDFRTIIR